MHYLVEPVLIGDEHAPFREDLLVNTMIVTAQRHSHHFAIIVLCKVQWMVSSMAVFIQSLVHHDTSISQNTTTTNQ